MHSHTAFGPVLAAALAIIGLTCGDVAAQSRDLGNGFRDHGRPGRANGTTGGAVTVDGEGRDVVLLWLNDNTGVHSLAMIDAQTGAVAQFSKPWQKLDMQFANFLSSRGRYYSLIGGFFVEFDPIKRGFSFVKECQFPSSPALYGHRCAMGMAEGDDGTIWVATYPYGTVVSYNPESGKLRDYGAAHPEPAWDKGHQADSYPGIAVDDQGWAYVGIGPGKEQIVIVNPATGKMTPIVPEAERRAGQTGNVTRDRNGKVYGCVGGQWYEFHGGATKVLVGAPTIDKIEQPSSLSGWGSILGKLRSGETVKALDLRDPGASRLVIEDPATRKTRVVEFAVTGGGSNITFVTAVQDGTIIAVTKYPKELVSYEPDTDKMTRRSYYPEWMVADALGDLLYIGGYGFGFMLEWNTARPWLPAERGIDDTATIRSDPRANPRHLTDSIIPGKTRHLNRPMDLLAHPDGRWVILSGHPDRGLAGGGLTFWDRKAEVAEFIPAEQLIPNQSISRMLLLPGGKKLLCGTDITPELGGVRTAEVAELFVLDIETRKIEWRLAPLTKATRYYDMMLRPDGKVFGIADGGRFFVFDTATRQILHEEDFSPRLGSAAVYAEGPRIFVKIPDGRIYILLHEKGIAKLDPQTYEITLSAQTPAPIISGAYLKGRIYYGSATTLYSWQVPPTR